MQPGDSPQSQSFSWISQMVFSAILDTELSYYLRGLTVQSKNEEPEFPLGQFRTLRLSSPSPESSVL